MTLQYILQKSYNNLSYVRNAFQNICFYYPNVWSDTIGTTIRQFDYHG